MQVTVGSKYQIVIPKAVRKNIHGLRPGAKVMVNSLDDQTIAITANPQDWVTRTRGMMKQAWKGIDTTQELKKLRNEWHQKS